MFTHLGYISMSSQTESEYLAKVFLILSYGAFLYRNLEFLSQQMKPSVVLLAVFNFVVILVVLTRRPAKRVGKDWFTILVTLGGTYCPIFFMGSSAVHEIILLQIIGSMGLLVSLSGLWVLRKSFGLLPADRGIVQHGIYRLIRHPLYAGYFMSISCFLVQNLTRWNIICYCLWILCEWLRLLREERLLSQNPEYVEYKRKTKWRIFPFVW
jgi:protein-S-isoprenylcysteine O-methyltransferase Ste14